MMNAYHQQLGMMISMTRHYRMEGWGGGGGGVSHTRECYYFLRAIRPTDFAEH